MGGAPNPTSVHPRRLVRVSGAKDPGEGFQADGGTSKLCK